MHRTPLLASILAALLAGSASFAFAQNTPTPAPATTTASTTMTRTATPMRHRADGQRMGPHQRMAWKHGSGHERGGVIGSLRGLERLYMQAGRSKDLAALYTDVLARSQDPRVRDYVYQRLARLQAQPANVDQAIATLRKSLDENLANATNGRTEREKMRTDWQQRHAEKSTTPATPATPAG